jgi:hypothetical protein
MDSVSLTNDISIYLNSHNFTGVMGLCKMWPTHLKCHIPVVLLAITSFTLFTAQSPTFATSNCATRNKDPITKCVRFPALTAVTKLPPTLSDTLSTDTSTTIT